MIKDYAVENLELRKEYQKRIPRVKFEFRFGMDMTTDEKIQFINKNAAILPYYEKYEKYGGVATYLWNIIDRFCEERVALSKDTYGYVKTVSLKAWLKRNDPMSIVDNWYHYGTYRLFGYDSNINHQEKNSTYDVDRKDAIVNEWYKGLLNELLKVEEIYYTEHDPISNGIREIVKLEKMYGCLGSERIASIAGNGLSYTRKDWLDWTKDPPVTVEEIDAILAAYDKTRKFIENISAEINSNPAIKKMPVDKDESA